MPNYPKKYLMTGAIKEQMIYERMLKKITSSIQIDQCLGSSEIAQSIATLIMSQEKDPVIIENKIKNIGQQFLTSQVKIKLPLEESQQQLAQITKIKTKRQRVFQQINRLEIDQPDNDYIKQKVNQKKKYLSQKQQEIKKKYKVNFEPGQTQNDVRISTNAIDIQKIKKKIEKAIGKNSLVKITIDKVKSLRGGGRQQFNIKTQLQSQSIESYFKKFADNLEFIASRTKQAGNTQYFQAIKSYREKIQLNCQELRKKKENLEKQLKNKCASRQIDLCIAMDTTNSMGPYIQQAKTDSIGIINKFKQSYPDSSIKYSFISYKDHCKPSFLKSLFPFISNKDDCNSQVVNYYDFGTAEGIQNKINRVSAYARDGNDFPEAVHDGLWAATKLSWRPKSTKFVFLIFDAPPHGKQYSDMHDTYPNGCPCGIKLSQIANYYNSNKIHLNVKACGSQIGRTSEVFQKAFRSDLYGNSKLEASNFSEDISDEMKQKIQQINSKLSKITEDFVSMINTLRNKVQQDVQQLIKTEQQRSQLEEYFKSINEVSQYLEEVKKIKQQSAELKKIQQNEKQIPKISQSLSSILATSKKLIQLKKKTNKLKEDMREKNIEGLVEQLSQEINGLKEVGLGEAGILKLLQKKGIDHDTALAIIERVK